ncbi:unnamed protein product, partial [Prorocentrum cordatum]
GGGGGGGEGGGGGGGADGGGGGGGGAAGGGEGGAPRAPSRSCAVSPRGVLSGEGRRAPPWGAPGAPPRGRAAWSGVPEASQLGLEQMGLENRAASPMRRRCLGDVGGQWRRRRKKNRAARRAASPMERRCGAIHRLGRPTLIIRSSDRPRPLGPPLRGLERAREDPGRPGSLAPRKKKNSRRKVCRNVSGPAAAAGAPAPPAPRQQKVAFWGGGGGPRPPSGPRGAPASIASPLAGELGHCRWGGPPKAARTACAGQRCSWAELTQNSMQETTRHRFPHGSTVRADRTRTAQRAVGERKRHACLQVVRPRATPSYTWFCCFAVS